MKRHQMRDIRLALEDSAESLGFIAVQSALEGFRGSARFYARAAARDAIAAIKLRQCDDGWINCRPMSERVSS